MESNKQKKITDLLSKNKISEQDLVIWLKVCANLGDEEADRIIAALEIASVEEIMFLNKNIKDKIQVINKNDIRAQENIVDDEEKFLESIR